MMKRSRILSKLFYTAVVVFMSGVIGCVSDKLDGFDVQGESITLEMIIPGFEIPVTRSIAGEKGEAAVRSIDLLLFDQSTPAAKLIRGLKVSDFTQDVSGTDYKVKYRLKFTKDENVGTVVAIANASDEVDLVLSKQATGTEKQVVLEALKFRTEADENGAYHWNVSIPGYTPIPMYGETSVEGIAADATVNVPLTRMLARVDVKNEVKGDIFKLEMIYLVSYNTSGYIAPPWNTSDGSMIRDPYAGNDNPMIPNPAGKQEGTLDAAMGYEYKQDDHVEVLLLDGKIYAYEAAKTTKNDAKNGTCLIIKGMYRGAECYYRVDFTVKTSASATTEYMPLYRNHKYCVNIIAAEGGGYDTFEQALNSSTVLSNLKTTILVVDMNGINNIVYDGQFFMGVESRVLDMPYGVGRQLKHRVSSDYHGEWKAEVLKPNESSWLRLTGDQTASSGTDINQTGVDLVVTTIPSPGSGKDYVTGQIVFTAGRLRDTLTVRRVPIAEMFARSNIVRHGGNLIFAVTAEDNRTIPAWSQGVFFKWGSLVALAPAGNPYDPESRVVYTPAGLDPSSWGIGLAGWDRIPYAHPNFSFTTPSPSGDDADVFKEYSDNTGFNAGAGIGDICRYVSSGKDGKGWVEGKWRLPTYAELQLLYEETAVKTVKMGDFGNKMSDLNTNPENHADGMFDPESGWFVGANVTASIPSPENRKTPPAGTVFLPAAGHRYPNGDGNVVHVGAYGYYWSATPYTVNSEYTVNYLFIQKDGVVFYDADRSYAFPIRCIKDY